MTDLHLNTDGPRSGDYTLTVAAGLAECVRVLNNHTTGADALPDPSTIYSVLGDVHTTVGRLDQLLRQLGVRLVGMYDSGRMRDDSGEPVAPQVVDAKLALGDCQRLTWALSARLAAAVQATSGLYMTEQADTGDGDQ
ncbi:hypothetical protein ACQEVF_25055 [Nonomuraea polychroma]|uniref:hypothetical protein n=1 Tax=Nonomuraea polychroma TaxID=46176 RepID=UPI003D8D939E